MWLVLLGRDNQALDLGRQLVGVAHRPARAVAERLKAVLLVSGEDLVAGLSRDAEDATEITHRLAVQQVGDEPQALVHDRTLLPGHPHLPPSGGTCYPCVRYDLSPMSRAAHKSLDRDMALKCAIGSSLAHHAGGKLGATRADGKRPKDRTDSSPDGMPD